MTERSFSLTHLIREPRRRVEGRPPLLLLLHGLGSYEGDLFPLAELLDPRCFVVSARAPLTLQPGAYAWFNVQFLPHGLRIQPGEAEASRQLLLRFIDEVVAAYDLDPERVYLMGFSQGAIMSCSVALTEPEKVAGVIAMSGRILPEIADRTAAPERLRGLPFIVVHGIYDDVLPIAYGRASRNLLAGLPVHLTYHEYRIGHHTSPESLRDIAEWLTARLDGPRRLATAAPAADEA